MKKKLSVLVLALAMVLTMSASVFAADPVVPTGTPDNAYLVKYLKKAPGVDNPNATFTFNIAKNVAKGTAVEANYPTDPAAVTVAASAMSSANIDGTSDTKWTKKLSEIFTGTFKGAGVYAYTVTEAETGFTASTDPKITDSMEFSGEEFIVRIYVVNDDEGDGTHIKEFTVENKDGKKVDPTDVDPTPGTGDDDPQRDDPDYKADGFTFTNNYIVTTKQDPEDPQDPDPTNYGGFGVTKTVTGEYASKTDEFTFSVTIEKPLGFEGTTGKYIAGGEEKTFTYGTAFTPTLKHGENFGITEMALGSEVTIKEAANTKNYTPSVSGLISKTANKNSECGDTVVVGSSNKGQVAAFVNEMKDEDAPTPTGIIISNLPYVLLIGIALGGIILFSRKRRYE